MKKEIVLLGDSITQGLGSKKVNFTSELQKSLGTGYAVDNMAFTGTTVHYLEQIFDEILQKRPQYAVILYGNVDAQIRPSRTGYIYPLIPKRFQGGGMLMPRPFYSHTWHKRIGQRAENMIRYILRKVICAVDRYEQWVTLDEFQCVYQRTIKELQVNGIRPIICSTVYIDDSMFPGSLEQYKLFSAKLKEISIAENVPYVDLMSPLKKSVEDNGWQSIYCFDHFHPNGRGYQIISQILASAILKEETFCHKE